MNDQPTPITGEPASHPSRVCLTCGRPDPPPEQTCTLEPDHYVGRPAGCPACGRLVTACTRRPCSARRNGHL